MSLCAFADASTEITATTDITVKNLSLAKITDDNIATHSEGENVLISCTSELPLEGVYIKFNKSPSKGILNDNKIVSANGFLHEFIPLGDARSFTLEYEYTDICDLYIYSSGKLPQDVQIWESGKENTDILLCATHSDDDQLFFAGLLPYYAGERKLRVRVAYFINHYDTYYRTHELLDGLWHCGVTLYPDISLFPDGYSESAEGALKFLENKGFDYSNILDFQHSLIDKYKPLIAVLHDFNGEYGHGAHMLNTKSFVEACESRSNGDYIPEKIYIHLYDDNQLFLDIDAPMDAFGGKSAFNVSQEAFRFHKSQHWTWFYKWFYGTNGSIKRSSQIRSYNPAKYGLYFSRVGNDTGINDMTENIVTYDERQDRFEKQFSLLLNSRERYKYSVSSIENSDSESSKYITVKRSGDSGLLHWILLFSVIITLLTIAAIIIIRKHKK